MPTRKGQTGLMVLVLGTVAAMVMATVRADTSASAKRFFAPGPPQASLPEDELFPRGRQLMFSLYSLVSPEVEQARADGFTCIGPYYGDQQKGGVIEKAKRAGVKCTYAVGRYVDFVRNPKYVMPSDEELRQTVQRQIAAVAEHREIGVWYLVNEELRYWRPDEMRWLRVTAEACRSADPLHRPVMMYDPNNRTADALARTVRYLDFASKGMYANAAGFTHNRIWIRWGVEQEVEACKRANPKAVPVAVLWMAKDPADPPEDEWIDEWTRHDVYLGLVSGAKGIVVFSGWNGRPGFQRTFKKYYQGYSAAAKELTGELGLGQVFLFGEVRGDLRLRVLSGPATLRVDYQKQSVTYPSVSHLEAAYGEGHWLFLVNSAESTIRVAVQGLPNVPVRMRDVFKDDSYQTLGHGNGKMEVELPPLGVRAFEFRPATNGK